MTVASCLWDERCLRELFEVSLLRDKAQLVSKTCKLSDNAIKCLIEALCNILSRPNHYLPKLARSRIQRHLIKTRKLASIRDVQKARSYCEQRGAGFLPVVLPIIVSTLTGLLADAVR